MAWMNQERKATLATGLKKVMPKGWKYSLAVCSTAPMMRCDRCHSETIDVRRRENGNKLCDLCSDAREGCGQLRAMKTTAMRTVVYESQNG